MVHSNPRQEKDNPMKTTVISLAAVCVLSFVTMNATAFVFGTGFAYDGRTPTSSPQWASSSTAAFSAMQIYDSASYGITASNYSYNSSLTYSEGGWDGGQWTRSYLQRNYTRAAGDTTTYQLTVTETVLGENYTGGLVTKSIRLLYSTDSGSTWTGLDEINLGNNTEGTLSGVITIGSAVTDLWVRRDQSNDGKWQANQVIYGAMSESFSAIPEPASLALLMAGGGLLLRRRRG